MPAEQIDIFNKDTRPVSFAEGNETRFNTKENKWFWAMMLACLLKLVSIFKGSPISPSVLSFSITQAVSVLRDSPNPARVRITNHGPGTVWVTFGTTPPVAPLLPGPVVPVATAIIPAFASADSPCPVIGEVRAVAHAGDGADVTLTVFCA